MLGEFVAATAPRPPPPPPFKGYDPVFEWWVKDPATKLSKALTDYATTLRERGAGLKKDDRDTIIGDPIGREALLNDLRADMIAYTPEELIDIANREFTWCEAELRKASKEMGLGEDTKAAVERVKNLHPNPGGQPKMILDMVTEAIDFVTSRNLVSVPQLARDSWRVLMMSPERQRINPFFLGGESIIISQCYYTLDSQSQGATPHTHAPPLCTGPPL